MWKQYLIGLAVSLAALYFFFQAASLGEMADALSRVDPVWLVPNLALIALAFVLRALRWQVLMRPVGRLGLGRLFNALMVGFLANNILPAHLGEVVRAFAVGREAKGGASAVLATIVLERICDGLAVLFMLLMVLMFLDLPQGAVAGSHLSAQGLRWGGWTGLVLFAGLLAVLVLFRWQRERGLSLLGFLLGFLPQALKQRVLGAAASFSEGLAVSRPRDLGLTGFYSLVIWVAYGMWAWSLLPAFGLQMGFWSGVLVEVVVALALIIPAAPGFVGTFHVAASAALVFMGVDATIAASYAMMLWLGAFRVHHPGGSDQPVAPGPGMGRAHRPWPGEGRGVTGREEDLRISHNGTHLAARLHHPAGQPLGVVMVAHGLLSSMASQKLTLLGRALATAGYLTCRYDAAGCGDSPGRIEDTTLTGRRDELMSVARWLSGEHPGLGQAYLGSSLGGSAALSAAALLPPRALVCWSSPFDLSGVAADPQGPDLGALRRDALNHDFEGMLGRISRIFLVHGEDDEVVPVGQARRAFQLAAQPKDLLILAGADHRLTSSHDQLRATARTLAWLERMFFPPH
jgi:uncharacterized protein (TIRG00374 family)